MEKSIQDWKVLVADNSAVMGRLIKNYLVQMGLKGENITLARDGNQASMMADLMPFDLVTAGRHMKCKDGLELLADIRGNSDEAINTVRFLMISSEGSAQLMADILSAGGNGLLSKPFHPRDLAEMLNRIGNGNNGFVCLSESERYNEPSEEKNDPHSPEGAEGEGVPGKLIDVFVQSTVEGLGQYMVQAQPGEPCGETEVSGDLISSLDLSDTKSGMKFVLMLLFPKKAACTIYETLFGEVDTEMVCGIVGELNNIIGGAVKPHLTEMAGLCHKMIHPDGDPLAEGTELELQLGFPESKWLSDEDNGFPKESGVHFCVPFQLGEGQMFLSVSLQPA